MSAVPSDDRNRPPREVQQPDWQVRTGLTLIQAEELLDLLESAGVKEREASITPEGVTVRWRGTWPRLMAE